MDTGTTGVAAASGMDTGTTGGSGTTKRDVTSQLPWAVAPLPTASAAAALPHCASVIAPTDAAARIRKEPCNISYAIAAAVTATAAAVCKPAAVLDAITAPAAIAAADVIAAANAIAAAAAGAVHDRGMRTAILSSVSVVVRNAAQLHGNLLFARR
eukprot:365530-Chlamydomonas_euryale.AAC.20